MRGFGGNCPYTVIVVMLCLGVGLDAIYLERPVWEVDVGGRRPRPFAVMPQQSYGGSADSELGDWSWNNPDLMYYQPEYNSAEYAESQGPDSGFESQLSERTHFQEAQQASQVKKPVYEAEEEQVPYLAPRPYAVPQPMEQDREDGWGKPMLYQQPSWQSETAPVRPYQPPQPQEQQQSRPPKPNQMPPRVPGDRPQGQWAEKGPENDFKESMPSASTADRLMQLQMLQQQQWMQEQQLKQQELAQQQNQLRQQEMIQQQLKQQQLLQQQQEQQQKLQQQKLKQQQLQQEQERLKQQQEAQRLQEEEKQRELELLERQKELKRQQEQQRQQELMQQQQQEQMRQRELQRQQELQQQQEQMRQRELQQQQQLKLQELQQQQEQMRQRELQRQQELQQQQEQMRLQELQQQQQKLKQPQPYMPVQPVQPKPAPVQRPVKRPQPSYNPQPEYYAGANDDDDDPYEPVPYQKPVISVDARCPRNDDPAKPVHLPSTSCSKFMKCFNGIAYEMSCPGGLEFDKKTNRCDYAAIVRCSKP